MRVCVCLDQNPTKKTGTDGDANTREQMIDAGPTTKSGTDGGDR